MNEVDIPNAVFPLAASYNERGVDGYATTVTNGEDQRKINSIYEPVKNALTGKTTLYLVKRPGIPDGGITLNSAMAIPFLIISVSSAAANANHWVFGCDSSNDMLVANTVTSTSIQSAGGTSYPRFVDKTLISGVETVVVQSDTPRVFYASAIGSWTEITDSDFPSPLGKMEFMDGYAFALNSANKIFNSDVNSLANWGATSYITKQITQDYPRGLAKCGRIILAFGEQSVEGFYNAGNPSGSPLTSVPDIAQKIGLGNVAIARYHYSAMIGKNLYFVGAVHTAGSGTSEALYRFDGSRFEMVSTRAINKILTGGTVTNVQTVDIGGMPCIGIDLSTVNNGTQRWLCFYPEWNDWFEWTNTYVKLANNGKFFVGTSDNPTKVGKLAVTDAWIDGISTAYTMTHQFKIPQKGNYRQSMKMFGVVGDTQSGTSNLGVEFSDDDYATFSAVRNIDLTKTKKNLYRCGSFHGRAVRLTHSNNTDCRLELAVARIE